jgi:hypothetical protein
VVDFGSNLLMAATARSNHHHLPPLFSGLFSKVVIVFFLPTCHHPSFGKLLQLCRHHACLQWFFANATREAAAFLQPHGGFHKWGYPNSWMVQKICYLLQNPSIMDD